MRSTGPGTEGWDRAVAAGLLAVWTLLAAFCSLGMAPAVDLPAHGAHLETLAGVVRGDPLVSSVYVARFVPGYGLVYWLALPLALLSDGATAVRVFSFITLELFALGVLLLLRALGRPAWTLLLALPLAFNVSYWYGFLPFAFAASIGLLTVAALARWAGGGGRSRAALFLAGMTLTWLAHLPVAVVLGVVAWTAALTQRPEQRRAMVRLVAAGSVLPVVLTVPAVLQMLERADALDAGRTVHDPLSHLNWFFHNFRPEGWLAWTLPLAVTLVFVVLYLRRRREEPGAPFAVACALAVLYLLTPRHVVGASHLAVRLPALVALAALLAADARALPRWLSVALCALSVTSLGETAAFHLRFREAVAGWERVARPRPAGRHAYQPLGSDRVLGSRIPYLYHLGAWETAAHGGVGNDLFAGNAQEPLGYRPGEELPPFLREFTPAQIARLDAILLFGTGPVPSSFAGFCVAAHAGDWRRLERCRGGWTLRVPLDRRGIGRSVGGTMVARVYITLKPGVLDPAGKAVESSLHSLGFQDVGTVRLGKYVELQLPDGDRTAAKARVEEMCKKLLANTVVENYRVEFPG